VSVVNILGTLKQQATLENPSGPPVPDGDGSFTQVYAELTLSPWRCAIQKATLANSEKHFSQAIVARATHVINGRYNPEMSMQTRVTWTDRNGDIHIASVIDMDDTEGVGIETVALVTELTT
jgi:hypothetical protein